MAKIKFSLIASVILAVSSFIPVLQIILLHLNSFIAQPIGMLLGKNDNIGIYGVNGFSSLLMFVLFYFSNSIATRVLSLLGILLFFIPFLFYATENIISTDKYYFLQFLVIGIVTGIFLLLVEIMKSKAAQ